MGLQSGTPADMARVGTGAQMDGFDALEAPLRLRLESYEAFVERLPHAREDAEAASNASVVEELRRLQIDPAIFYRDASGRGAQRLGLRRFSPDDVDPTASPELGCSIGRSPHEAAAGDPDALAALLGFEDDDTTDVQDVAPEPQQAAALPGLNMPDDDEDFEICLDEGGETRGGRLGHETPEGLSTRLQIDSLTDDGDEDDFRADVLAEDAVAEGDGIEPFALDPEFNYDAVENLSSRFFANDEPAERLPGTAAEPSATEDKTAITFDPAPRAEVVDELPK